ncbi:hypothetical protein RhiirA4_467976 [Rhizophagus irregularis]|uniref:Uncharacterized protein n=1 Tax=Rhizophagus irregularis TaxID=588596 RepID=A0A2I1GWV8_9GLOM|nr:hypothetical protein RhiirA4_467976 [Rhizophagus irregularis]
MDTTTEINDEEVTTGCYQVQENRRIYIVRRKTNRACHCFETGKDIRRALKNILEMVLYRERIAALKYEQIKMQSAEILEKNKDLTKKLADSNLINGLMVADLENRIRNLEVDVIAKRIMLKKSEANNILWEKIKALEVIEEKPTCQKMEMDLFGW